MGAYPSVSSVHAPVNGRPSRTRLSEKIASSSGFEVPHPYPAQQNPGRIDLPYFGVFIGPGKAPSRGASIFVTFTSRDSPELAMNDINQIPMPYPDVYLVEGNSRGAVISAFTEMDLSHLAHVKLLRRRKGHPVTSAHDSFVGWEVPKDLNGDP
jgi:hypothetical protein